MRPRLLTIFVALLLISADAPKQTRKQADIAALQGLWVLKVTEFRGLRAEQDPVEDEPAKRLRSQRRIAEERELPDDSRQYRTTLEFRGNTFEHRQWIAFLDGEGGRVRLVKGTYTIDDRRRPPVMEWRGGEGKEVRSVSWIYSVRGDALQCCIHLSNDPERLPTTFATDKDDDLVLLTYRREKK